MGPRKGPRLANLEGRERVLVVAIVYQNVCLYLAATIGRFTAENRMSDTAKETNGGQIG